MVYWLPAIAAALVYWKLSLRDGHGWPRSVIKGLAVMPLALMALVQGTPLVACALALCSLGDVILSRPGQRAFLGGLIAFALGHVVWIAVFVAHFPISLVLVTTPMRLLLLVAFVLLAVSMARVLIPNAGALKLPVTIYLCIIAAMGVSALATPSTLIVAGAALFVASDSLLGLQTFVVTRDTQKERLANALIWPLYWGAIACLTIATVQ